MISSCGQQVSGEAQSAAGEAQPTDGDSVSCDAGVVFVLDVSLSMDATDVAPSRLAAAKRAAKDFAAGLPDQTPLGFVTFAGTAQVVTRPSTDRDEFDKAIDSVTLSERTATGEGIFTALSATGLSPASAHRIILISDGKQTVPADLNDSRGAYTAAQKAEQGGVPISTISLGTDQGEVAVPGGTDGHTVRVPTDPESLREIARLSGGEFHDAASAEELTTALEAMSCDH
ncbi:VWA domain-containing protein [Nocardia cyriacigeorgica]|nr:VWA domain-containing protein [Nocardia cyriacigeorgica]